MKSTPSPDCKRGSDATTRIGITTDQELEDLPEEAICFSNVRFEHLAVDVALCRLM
jgi:hypothetical protein